MRAFVEKVSSSLNRLQRVILIRFQVNRERLYLLFDPELDSDDMQDGKQLVIPTLVQGRDIIPMKDLQLTREEIYCVSDSLGESFSDSGIKAEDWPFAFEMTEDWYKYLRYSTEDLRKAKHITLWQRRSKSTEPLKFPVS